MQNRKYLLAPAFVWLALTGHTQTTTLPLWAKESWLIDRMEIKAQRDNSLNLSVIKPYLRRVVVAAADSLRRRQDAGENEAGLTKVDWYNLNRLQANSSEYSSMRGELGNTWKSRSGASGFFPTPGNMIEVDQDKFYLSVNPAMSFQQGVESDSDVQPQYWAAGLTARGLIGRSLGFQFFGVRVGERGPQPFREFVMHNNAVPGARFFDSSNGRYGYNDIRGSLNWRITPYIDMQAGYDQVFIGNGYRSLLLSHFAPPQLFLKIQTRIWRLQYTNLFTQLSATTSAAGNDRHPNKYASKHHLSVNATRWLNIGVFESIVFGRRGGYDISYLQPLIFLRSIEQQNGSPDNANIGADFKANIAKKAQVYGQLMLDEFVKDEVIGSSRYWWGNKQAFQLGAKYVDAFGIANLDLQGELNQVRPFMYSFRDTVGAYTHALQPLAHPLGGNLRELTGMVRYQPLTKLYLQGRISYWKQGLDSAGFNFGANPNQTYNSVNNGGNRLRNDNYPMFSGIPAQGVNGQFVASYELRENMFVELNAMMRAFKRQDAERVNASWVTLGIRWNMYRREYDY